MCHRLLSVQTMKYPVCVRILSSIHSSSVAIHAGEICESHIQISASSTYQLACMQCVPCPCPLQQGMGRQSL